MLLLQISCLFMSKNMIYDKNSVTGYMQYTVLLLNTSL